MSLNRMFKSKPTKKVFSRAFALSAAPLARQSVCCVHSWCSRSLQRCFGVSDICFFFQDGHAFSAAHGNCMNTLSSQCLSTPLHLTRGVAKQGVSSQLSQLLPLQKINVSDPSLSCWERGSFVYSVIQMWRLGRASSLSYAGKLKKLLLSVWSLLHP